MQTHVYAIDGDLAGEAVGSSALELRSIDFAAIDTFRLSLKNVRRIDASGVVLLMQLHSELERHGTRFIVEDTSVPLLKLFSRLGLNFQTQSVEVVRKKMQPSSSSHA